MNNKCKNVLTHMTKNVQDGRTKYACQKEGLVTILCLTTMATASLQNGHIYRCLPATLYEFSDPRDHGKIQIPTSYSQVQNICNHVC